MPDINLIDPNLKNYNHQTEISIQAGLSGFSFCISTPDKQIGAFRHYSFPHITLQEDLLNYIHDIIQRDELLNQHFLSTRVTWLSRKSTLIPSELFRAELCKQFLEFNQPLADLDEIHYSDIPYGDSKLVFALPSYFAGIITEKFRNAVFFNQAAPLLAYASNCNEGEEKTLVYINLNKEFFDIAVITDGNLKLYNNFLYVHSVDLIYFILYVCKQLEIDLDKALFHVSGEFSDNKQYQIELSRHLSRIATTSEIEGIRFAPRLQKLQIQKFNTLFNLTMCE